MASANPASRCRETPPILLPSTQCCQSLFESQIAMGAGQIHPPPSLSFAMAVFPSTLCFHRPARSMSSDHSRCRCCSLLVAGTQKPQPMPACSFVVAGTAWKVHTLPARLAHPEGVLASEPRAHERSAATSCRTPGPPPRPTSPLAPSSIALAELVFPEPSP